jgi:hypothetical protein
VAGGTELVVVVVTGTLVVVVGAASAIEAIVVEVGAAPVLVVGAALVVEVIVEAVTSSAAAGPVAPVAATTVMPRSVPAVIPMAIRVVLKSIPWKLVGSPNMLKLAYLSLVVGLSFATATATASATTVPSTLPGTGETIPAPMTHVAPDGRSVSDGTRALSADVVASISPGASVAVSGRGYDEGKGIYVAFCRIPERDQLPSPCGGGATTTGSTGSSVWISSNPPTYGVGLAVPYGSGGTFSTTLHLNPVIDPSTDCRHVACAVTTRNDHTRSSDRSQDLFLPVTFVGSTLTTTTTTTTTAAGASGGQAAGERLRDSAGDSAGSGTAVAAGAAVALVAATAATALVAIRSRRRRTS